MLVEDIPLLAQWFCEDPIAIDFLGSNLASIEKVKKFFHNALENPESRRDFIMVNNDGKAIGASSLEHINWKHRHAESVNFIGEQGYRKKEVIIEAHLLIFDYAFESLNLNRIQWNILESNPRMLRILENWIKISGCLDVYKLEGILAEAYFTRNKYYSLRVYGILKNNYIRAKKSLHKCLTEEILKK